MNGVNKVILVGRLGADPEVKRAQSGKEFTVLAVATNETYTPKDGEKQTTTEWHRVMVWGKAGQMCQEFLTKGREVYIEGKIRSFNYDDDGTKKFSSSIHADRVTFLGKGKNGGEDNN